MKRAKRAVTLLLFFTLLFTMAACGQKAADPVVTTTPSGSSPTTATSMPPSGEADIRLLEAEGWMNYNYGFSQMLMALSDDGIYYTNTSGFLRYFDKDTGVSFTLCQKVGCLHEEEEDRKKREECEAIIGHPAVLFFWAGNIYFDKKDLHGHGLYSREADGTAERKLAELCTACRGEDLSYILYNFLFAEGSLYYRVNVQKQKMADGQANTNTKDDVLLHLDLTSGKERELFRINEEEGSFSLLAGHKDAVMIKTRAAFDIKEGGLEALYNAKSEVWLFSSRAVASKILLQMTDRELGTVVYLSGGELYSKPKGAETGRILNLLTGGQREHTLPGDHIYGDYYKTVTVFEDGSSQWTIYNAKTGQMLENELKDILCMAEMYANAEGVILELLYMDEDNGISTHSYCYIAFSNMADGLQKEDFTEIISEAGRG